MIYFVGLWHLQRSYVWEWAYEWDTVCGYPELPPNRTGLKVLVAGFAKTGTWAMTATLHSLGLPNTYHSEEFMVHVWNKLAREYWLRPENGGELPRTLHPYKFGMLLDEEERRTGKRPIADLEYVFKGQPVPTDGTHWPDDDNKVLADLKYETLAARVSRCRADSIAFDGIEGLYWPLFEMSPNVKVILLDWRDYESWKASVDRFGPKWFLLTFCTNLMWSSIHALPWGFLVKQVDRWYYGGRVQEMLRTGGAFLHEAYNVPVMLWCILVFQRKIQTHWWGGLMRAAVPEDEYHAFHAEVRRRTPPENLFRWNFKNNTYEDMCAFLELENCTRSGHIEQVPNVNAWDKYPWEEPVEPGMLTPIFLICHIVNWKVYRTILSLPYYIWKAFWSLMLVFWRKLRGRVKPD